jgi:hypothetical protein
LQNLKKLDVGQIWHLTSLHWSAIQSLPRTIGQLQNLKELNLVRTGNLTSLPKEIGNLTSLTILNIHCSSIQSLPPTIGQLQNLKELNLVRTGNLTSLPEEIGKLTSLTRLKLWRAAIQSLPHTIGRLQNLEYLNLSDSDIQFLPSSVAELRGLLHFDTSNTAIRNVQDVLCLMLQSRARFKTNSIERSPHLWPLALKHASRAFTFYYKPEYDEYYASMQEQPNAIYWLLLHGRESFINVILLRPPREKEFSMEELECARVLVATSLGDLF